MNSDLESVKKDVQKGNVTLSSLAVDELYCPRLVFITPYVPEGRQGLVKHHRALHALRVLRTLRALRAL